MEIRKIVVVESGGQRKHVIETGAETLAELKQALNAANIDYTDKTFFEGLSKTELLRDDSLLPRDIHRNGTVTNNLVIMITTAQKKIKSGAMSRLEAYAAIKQMGLQDACMEVFGKNFTMCKTADLINLIENAHQVEEPTHEECTLSENTSECVDVNARKAISILVELLYHNDIFDCEEADMVTSALFKKTGEGVPNNSPYTDSEIEEMMNECGL